MRVACVSMYGSCKDIQRRLRAHPHLPAQTSSAEGQPRAQRSFERSLVGRVHHGLLCRDCVSIHSFQKTMEWYLDLRACLTIWIPRNPIRRCSGCCTCLLKETSCGGSREPVTQHFATVSNDEMSYLLIHKQLNKHHAYHPQQNCCTAVVFRLTLVLVRLPPK
jgi:hypothetical protein